MKKTICGCALIACAAVSTAQAQTIVASTAQTQMFNDLQIRLVPFTLKSDGGEKPLDVSFSTGPITLGKPVNSTFSWTGKSCDGWMVSTAQDAADEASVAWRFEITPTRVVGDVVVFRLRWARFGSVKRQTEMFSFEANNNARMGTDDVELTLRPGESTVVDAVKVPEGAKTAHGAPCGNVASIRVSVEPYPSELDERRLVGAELWLIERLPNGTEAQRSQPLNLRGLPNHPISFYFDRLNEAKASLDIYGIVKSRPASDVMVLVLETRCRWHGPGGRSDFSGPQRSVKSEVQVKPSEIVEVQLPVLEDDAGPFAKRKFSIRIRVRQIR
jgi:hypothetical protein